MSTLGNKIKRRAQVLGKKLKAKPKCKVVKQIKF